MPIHGSLQEELLSQKVSFGHLGYVQTEGRQSA